ncbi:hypothetical protein C8Q78DRAFT_121660 [Trametes maxima]|nr:hypothetical protein C8Q78DRAFT_121660 [Trametes maxima]
MLIGGQIALFLSGVVFMQVIMYHQLYPSDSRKIKTMVFIVWFLDFVHSAMICILNWENLVANYGNFQYFGTGNWYIVSALIALSILRLVSTMVGCAEMFRFSTFEALFAEYKSAFIISLSASAATDVLVTSILCYYLRSRRSGLARTDRVVDFLTLYTVETGMLTCITTLASLFCWVAMPTTQVFFAVLVSVSKLYANSLLASLNARRLLWNKSQGSSGQSLSMSILFPTQNNQHDCMAHLSSPRRQPTVTHKPICVNIDVEHSVDRLRDEHGGRSPTPVRKGQD